MIYKLKIVYGLSVEGVWMVVLSPVWLILKFYLSRQCLWNDAFPSCL